MDFVWQYRRAALLCFMMLALRNEPDTSPGGVRTVGGKKTDVWPRKRVARVDGDVILGALFPVHSRSDVHTCGPIIEQEGIQPLEMLLFTLDKINQNATFLPNITIGARILDSCDSDAYALGQAVEFIKGAMTDTGDSEYVCVDGSSPVVKERHPIVGVIGGASSVVSIQVANLLRLFKLPQVSYWSTSPDLSNKDRFDYFFRTVASDVYQARAMVEILKAFNWTYISAVYEDSNYGIKGISAVEDLARASGICIAVSLMVSREAGDTREEEFNKILQELLDKPKAKAVIVYLVERDAKSFFAAVSRFTLSGKFIWIGSDGWGGRQILVAKQEWAVEGAITVQPRARVISKFDEYFTSLKPDTNVRNPWFKEAWESHFECRIPGTADTPFNDFETTCSDDMVLDETSGYQQNSLLQLVAESALAFAHALKDMHADYCGDEPGLCSNMTTISGESLKDYLLNVSFEGHDRQEFHFQPNGDGPPRYTIMNFQRDKNDRYSWKRVGYLDEEIFRLQMKEIHFGRESVGYQGYPVSMCSAPCPPGHEKKISARDSCCWSCNPCSEFQYLSKEDFCTECPLGQKPDKGKTTCVSIPEDYLTYGSAYAIAIITFAIFGIICTLLVAAIFMKYGETPVVKASGRELCYVLLVGIFCSHAITFVLVAKPTTLTCGMTKVSVGVCYALCYAALLTKTNRIYRIFHNKGKKKQKYISPNSQLFITFMFVLIEVVVVVAWLIVSPPGTTHFYPSREQNQLVCTGANDASYTIGLAYPFLLMILCTVYAIKTRNVPGGFNEAKLIGFTMYTTCVIWLAFVPIYFVSASNVAIRVTALSVSIGLSGTVTLVCLFAPRVYIILFHPEENTRHGVMRNTFRSKIENGAFSVAADPPSTYQPCGTKPSATISENIDIQVDIINKNNQQLKLPDASPAAETRA
ncbi:metabotropic glutamate receptor 3-like [Branchiostoma floridae]|uniref:Metabotropic glutamate receptor 3-like n=1 Tax=Branchiostoma floridae TaxID=7739 RepID=A0A9J7NBE5_BRAFL|nr:metabotropic glutamate receptor 3-like [Branchiostoma floridae]